jgi:hypothetical protein
VDSFATFTSGCPLDVTKDTIKRWRYIG